MSNTYRYIIMKQGIRILSIMFSGHLSKLVVIKCSVVHGRKDSQLLLILWSVIISLGSESWFPYQMLFMLFNSNIMGITIGAGTAYPSGTPEFTPPLFLRILYCSIFTILCSVLQTSVFFLSIHLSHCIVYPSLIYIV